jgi:hypothetical protein
MWSYSITFEFGDHGSCVGTHAITQTIHREYFHVSEIWTLDIYNNMNDSQGLGHGLTLFEKA